MNYILTNFKDISVQSSIVVVWKRGVKSKQPVLMRDIKELVEETKADITAAAVLLNLDDSLQVLPLPLLKNES